MVDYKYSELYKQESIDKQMNIAFDGGNITNDDIHSEQFELTESLCSESELRFGSCEASMIKFRISNIFTPLKDKWLTVTETLNHNTDIPFQFGKYKVYSDTPTADRRYRDVLAYDKMYDIINTDLTDWYNSLFTTDDTEMTLKEFRDSLMNYLGVEQEDVTLVNDNMIIKKTIQPTQLAGRDVVSAICEINGCFGHIGRNGKFHYVFLPKYAQGLYPSNNLYPSNDLYPRDSSANKIDTSLYIDCKYEDYLSQRITKLQIRQEENDIGTIYPGGISTESDNTYIIQDNFLVYGKSASELEEIAGNLFEIIEDTEYRPFNAEVVGNPCFEVGDAIRFNTKYQIVESYVINRTLKGVQGLIDSFSADGEEYYSEKVNAIETQINQLKGKTNTLERNVEETRSEIKDVEKGLQSEILQTADSITSTVASAQSKWDTTGYTIDFYGYGFPSISAEENPQKIYLDQTTGKLYKVLSNGPNSFFWQAYMQLSLLTDELSSRIEQTISSISIEINNGDKTAGIVITLENEDGSTSDVEGTIEMTGMVTFNDLKGEGQTVINGSNITTGTIDADKVNVINVVAESVAAENITGNTISGKTISGGSLVGTNISSSDTIKMLVHYNALSTGYENVLRSSYEQIGSGSLAKTESVIRIAESNIARFVNSVFFDSFVEIKNLSVSGTKSRLASTKNYNDRLLYCYEMPSPLFGDIGHGVIGDDGLCYVDIDSIFAETIDTIQQYYVFLQPYSDKPLYVKEKTENYFVVCGEPNTEFDWEIKAKQSDFPMERLDENSDDEFSDIDYVSSAEKYLENYEKELTNNG